MTPEWKARINIKQFINKRGLSDQEAMDKVHAKLSTGAATRTIEKLDNPILLDIVDEMGDAVGEGDRGWFNDTLECLYDEADISRLWLG